MVGEINTDETALLHLLMDTGGRTRYKYYQKEEQESIEVVQEATMAFIKNANRKLNIDLNETPKIDIKLELKASIDEYIDGLNLNNPEEKKRLEEAIAKSIEADSSKLLEYLQEIGSDPLGIGEIIRSKHNLYWKSVEGEEVYSNIDFNIDVKLEIEFFGAIY
ncbi:Spore germination B3/ GerAC like, C-terminal [Natronincola peptidivorans]|uniref:Spore germination B3/ GerAC like, C-terminal n=1 Tax=Natronincola peptidivorans TaxID=426128 RepID=A0A1I0CIJ6_9FIRM|nr:Ger(x)C family spore germination C-terminal domain-containing protein [Natronincola peptidivorans]SET19382.1 Spore germination B3/ GerAC like, C-terminal [Natronincola peptidivorans]